MSDRAAYFALVRDFPKMFQNPPGAGIEILLEESDIEQAERYIAGKLRASGAPTEWAEVGVAFEDQYVCLIRDAVRFADGTLGTYIREVSPGVSLPGVVILPVHQRQVLLVRHFRHATRTWHLELPRGFGASADSTESARQELSEEIGATDVKLHKLGSAYPDASATNSTLDFFYADIGSYSRPDPHEAISEILPVAMPDLERMIIEGELMDGYLLMAYGLAKARNLI